MRGPTKEAACHRTEATVAFVLMNADGSTLKLDEAGNAKAAEAMKNRADRSTEPNAAPAAPSVVTANITGELDGDTIKVETIALR